MELKISAELKKILRPLSDDERKQLEDNIIADGSVSEPIVYWAENGDNLIVDGMNRFEIAEENGFGFTTKEKKFASMNDAIDWIERRQLGRRNLSETDRAELVGRRFNRLKDSQGGDRKTAEKDTSKVDEKSKPHSEALKSDSGKTAAKVAREAGVSRATVERAGKFVKAKDSLIDELIVCLDHGTEYTQKDVISLAKRPKKFQRQVLAEISRDDSLSLSQAIKSAKSPETKPTEEDEYEEDESIEDLVKGMTSEIESFCRRVKSLIDEMPNFPHFAPHNVIAGAGDKMRAGCTTLRANKPVVCPHCEGDIVCGCKTCKGKNCESCKGLGYVSTWTKESIPLRAK